MQLCGLGHKVTQGGQGISAKDIGWIEHFYTYDDYKNAEQLKLNHFSSVQ